MLSVGRILILTAILLTGCRTAKHAAVSTFRVIDAPARFVRDRIDPPDQQTTTTTTTTAQTGQSDVVTPGRPVAPATQRPPTTSTRTASTTHASPSPRPHPSTSPRAARTETTPTNGATPRSTPAVARTTPSAPPTEYPTARPVPGKPGFVYSIDPNGGMVDVTGYKSGEKAKDPYTHQVFIVP